MKKIIVLGLIAAVGIASCKKSDKVSSQIVTASTPTVTLTGASIYDIPVGGALPTISATAYDSFYKVSVPVKIDQSTLDNSTPGLYTVNITATNQYGYVGSSPVLIAVTNRSASEDLSGGWTRPANGVAETVTKIGTGLYYIDNVAGSTLIVGAYFVVTNDSTVSFGTDQPTSDGPLSTSTNILTLAVGDTSMAYAVLASGFGTSVRTFTKN